MFTLPASYMYKYMCYLMDHQAIKTELTFNLPINNTPENRNRNTSKQLAGYTLEGLASLQSLKIFSRRSHVYVYYVSVRGVWVVAWLSNEFH